MIKKKLVKCIIIGNALFYFFIAIIFASRKLINALFYEASGLNLSGDERTEGWEIKLKILFIQTLNKKTTLKWFKEDIHFPSKWTSFPATAMKKINFNNSKLCAKSFFIL